MIHVSHYPITLHSIQGDRHIHSNDGVHNSHSSIERELGNLRSRKLAVRVSESHHCRISLPIKCVGADTVEAGLSHGILDGIGVLQMDCLRDDRTLGDLACVFGEEERANLLFGTQFCVDIRLVTNGFLDLRICPSA